MRKDKMYIIRKRVMAPSLKIAMRKDKEQPPDEIWIDEDWAKQNENLSKAIGFITK